MDADQIMHGNSPGEEDESAQHARKRRQLALEKEYETKLREYERLKDRTGMVPPDRPDVIDDDQVHYDKVLLFAPFHIGETTLGGDGGGGTGTIM